MNRNDKSLNCITIDVTDGSSLTTEGNDAIFSQKFSIDAFVLCPDRLLWKVERNHHRAIIPRHAIIMEKSFQNGKYYIKNISSCFA